MCEGRVCNGRARGARVGRERAVGGAWEGRGRGVEGMQERVAETREERLKGGRVFTWQSMRRSTERGLTLDCCCTFQLERGCPGSRPEMV